jgi:hypothetical protein
LGVNVLISLTSQILLLTADLQLQIGAVLANYNVTANEMKREKPRIGMKLGFANHIYD